MIKLKQVVVVRKDLNMRKGKLAAQVGHAVQLLITDIFDINVATNAITEWSEHNNMKKVVVGVDTEDQLMEIWYDIISDSGIVSNMVQDLGLTEFHGQKTTTCISLFGLEEDVDKYASHLKLL